MKYVSIDIETTGLDPLQDNILQLAAVIEDTKINLPLEQLPRFNMFLWRPRFSGSAFALDLNKWIFKILSDYGESQKYPYGPQYSVSPNPFLTDVIAPYWMAPSLLFDWLKINGIAPVGESKKTTLNVAGKNFGTFDKLFLEQLEDWNKKFKIRQRIIDPAILFVDWDADDALPGLDQCKKRAGVSGEVTHDAVEDALDVIKIIRASRGIKV